MPRRGKRMTYEERLTCVQLKEAGRTVAQIAQERGWSSGAVRKWWRAYRKRGAAGLSPRMGRPKQGALGSYSAPVRAELERLRRAHPGWGPITLLAELAQLAAFVGVRLPSRARVAAFLKAQRLVREYHHRVALPAAPSAPAQQPHEEWELDAQGHQAVDGVGEISLVNIVDVVSRLKAESYPHLWGKGLSWEDYQLALRWAFVQYGLPERLSLDHDSAFFDNTSPSPYPSRLHLWLVALGIDVVFIQQPPPRQHARIERAHQTMTAQTLTGQHWSSQPALWHGLDQRRRFLNERYPSRSLAGRAPLQAFPQALHSGRAYQPEWEAELLDLHRLDRFLARGRWLRETNLHGEFWLGLQRYNAGTAAARTTQQITFDPPSREFVAQTVGGENLRRFAAKGLSRVDLMGELLPLSHLPVYQLTLPFSREDWRRLELTRLLEDTTS